MRELKLQLMIIKISVVIACLVIGFGVMQRLLEVKVPDKPIKTTAESGVSSQGDSTAKPDPGASGEGKGTDVQAPAETAKPVLKGKVVAIGDSYTFGYPYGMESSWVKLAGADLGREFVNKGKTSQASTDLLSRFKPDVVDLGPEQVIILIGTGDAMRGVSLDTFQKNVTEMVRIAKEKKISPVLAIPFALPDANVQKLVSAYRGWLTSYAKAENLTLLDFKELCDSGGNLRKEYSDDGKYPNKNGYTAMAQVVEKALK